MYIRFDLVSLVVICVHASAGMYFSVYDIINQY